MRLRLPTLAEVEAARPRAQPKPSARLKDKLAHAREDAKQLQAFRQAVWTRDKGQCRVCGRMVIKTLSLVPNRGEVHHLRGRNVTPEDRYNVKKARLLCAVCHGKAQRHEITVK